MMAMDCTGVILAGGENRRMPVLKSFIKVNGERIIERNLRILRGIFKEVFIVTNQPEFYVYLDVPLLGDLYDVRGPMTGIFTALLNSSYSRVFIVACDMPFINRALIEYMVSDRGDYDAVVPVYRNRMEPLFALYWRRLRASMEQAILDRRVGMKDFLMNKRVKYIKRGDIKDMDPEARSFVNINTLEDANIYLPPRDVLKLKCKSKHIRDF